MTRRGVIFGGTAALIAGISLIALSALAVRGCDVDIRTGTDPTTEGFCGVFDPIATLVPTVRKAIGPAGRSGMDGGSMAEALLAFDWRPDAARGAPPELRHDAELVVRTVRRVLINGTAAPLTDPPFQAAVVRLRTPVDRLCKRYRLGS